MRKIRAIVRKEWSEVFKNRMVLFAVAFMPLLFTALPLVILYTMGSAIGEEGMAAGAGAVTQELGGMGEKLCVGLNGLDCGQYVILSEFVILFLMMPVIIPVTIASYSIVGEKSARTLEPLLATPITTVELLVGKGLAAILPALAVTWVGYLIFLIGARLIGASPVVIGKFLAPLWMIGIFIVGPLLSVASVSLAVMVSSRANDPRVAEQIASLLVLPVVGIMVAQTAGFLIIDQTMILWMALIVTLVDVLFTWFAVQLFQRESILTRWK